MSKVNETKEQLIDRVQDMCLHGYNTSGDSFTNIVEIAVNQGIEWQAEQTKAEAVEFVNWLLEKDYIMFEVMNIIIIEGGVKDLNHLFTTFKNSKK